MLRSAQSTLRQLSASALMAAAAVAVTYPASAQDMKIAANAPAVEAFDPMAACKSAYAKSDADGNQCVINATKSEIKRVESDTQAAKARGLEADLKTACSQFLMEGVKNARFTKEQVVAAYGGKVTKEVIDQKGCDVARSLGFGKSAGLEGPSLN